MTTGPNPEGPNQPGASAPDPTKLPVRKDGLVVVVIETPSGSGNKLKFDGELGVYRLDRVLPAGMTFPFDFGFVPQTLGEDGDPLDAIVLLDSPVYPGCVVQSRMIGVVEVEQRERDATTWHRNDRLVAVSGGPKAHASERSLDDVDPFRLEAIESFFATYHALDGEGVRVLARRGPQAAEAAIRKAQEAFAGAQERAEEGARASA